MKNLSLSVKLKSISVFSAAMRDENGILSCLAELSEIATEQTAEETNEYSPYAEYNEQLFAEACAKVYSSLIENGKLMPLSDKIFAQLSSDENPLSWQLLRGEKPSRELLERAKEEYGYICDLATMSPDCFADKLPPELIKILPKWQTKALKPFSALINAYKKNGCGVFGESIAFSWDSENKTLVPVTSVDTIRLSDLKEYAEEKQTIINNTTAYLKGLPANNVLLYGDRGTGKSSTVHAILNEYAKDGLRLVEMNKSAITDFPLLVAAISQAKRFKFIIFIDDLSFSDGDNDYAALKAALEGSISKTPNILIYATTNRRHLIKESHSDRDDDVHRNDTTQEQLSLSDRFGLVITFINPDKKEFCTILKAILHDRKIDSFDDEKLSLYAERYAIKKGGRSPRAARQLADIIETSIKTGTEIDF